MTRHMHETDDTPPPLLSGAVEWIVSTEPVPYQVACESMEKRVEAIVKGEKPELIWLLEHPPLYTVGTSGSIQDILSNPHHIPVHLTGRGGQVTYHGPGQQVVYVLLNLAKRGLTVRDFVHKLEAWIMQTLALWHVACTTDPERIGVWVTREDSPQKIASIGVRVRRGISFHGLALNVNLDLQPFHQIVPCGIQGGQVTSLAAQKSVRIQASDIHGALRDTFSLVFGA